MIHEHSHWPEWVIGGFLVAAGISLAQAAFAATVFAGVTSGVLACVRIYFIIKYGKAGDA